MLCLKKPSRLRNVDGVCPCVGSWGLRAACGQIRFWGTGFQPMKMSDFPCWISLLAPAKQNMVNLTWLQMR